MFSLYKLSNKQSITQHLFNKNTIRLFSTHYSNELEWVKLSDDGKVATIGLTDFGQSRLGKVNSVELPKVDRKLKEEEKMGSLDGSNRTVFGLYAPVSGQVIEVNNQLHKKPGLVNTDPNGNGWMIKFKVTKPDEFKQLMDKSQYDVFVKNYR
ncbi:hypothetical protein DICPUDRAFT_87860 [Dictyostelium purpureum]|uniref:Lipoyl-binding domain-containing protein n=1 Tax=Dictyostelium purpureum TaxID=5786 RepID=F0ZKU3_DICPU|nr:uncharacterized protein DICPUDRAFT_87860 [Dictyostelium purpureum]EGC35420.1 hypothetical protein DICPUDRAFT_87860 [Dictyostelium purpureum]|eukprot:XP_003288033.1 hypothetical protein DICPUDRAFT_87860 [Dictyostelium purpureum]